MVLNKTNKRNTIKFNLICKIRIKRKTLKKNIFFLNSVITGLFAFVLIYQK